MDDLKRCAKHGNTGAFVHIGEIPWPGRFELFRHTPTNICFVKKPHQTDHSPEALCQIIAQIESGKILPDGIVPMVSCYKISPGWEAHHFANPEDYFELYMDTVPFDPSLKYTNDFPGSGREIINSKVELIRRLSEDGWKHGHPHYGNFVIAKDTTGTPRIFLIDWKFIEAEPIPLSAVSKMTEAQLFDRHGLDGAKFDERNFISLILTEDHYLSFSTWRNVHVQDGKIEQTCFEDSDLEGSVWNHCDFIKCSFPGASLNGTRFVNSRITGGTMARAEFLEGTDFSGTVFDNVGITKDQLQMFEALGLEATVNPEKNVIGIPDYFVSGTVPKKIALA